MALSFPLVDTKEELKSLISQLIDQSLYNPTIGIEKLQAVLGAMVDNAVLDNGTTGDGDWTIDTGIVYNNTDDIAIGTATATPGVGLTVATGLYVTADAGPAPYLQVNNSGIAYGVDDFGDTYDVTLDGFQYDVTVSAFNGGGSINMAPAQNNFRYDSSTGGNATYLRQLATSTRMAYTNSTILNEINVSNADITIDANDGAGNSNDVEFEYTRIFGIHQDSLGRYGESNFGAGGHTMYAEDGSAFYSVAASAILETIVLDMDGAKGRGRIIIDSDSASSVNHPVIQFGANTLGTLGLQEYLDNATAVAAGLPIGAIYRNGDVVQIVH